jgi:iron complex outermembrane recepter protein
VNDVGARGANTNSIAWRASVSQRTAIGSLLLVLVWSSLVVAQEPGEDLEGELEPEQDDTQPPAAPEQPDAAAPDAPEPAEPAQPAPLPSDQPVVEAEVGGAIEPTADMTADEPATASAAADEPEKDEVLVTGTRIKRSTAFAASAPVQVIDRKQLEYSGATNLADVVQYLSVSQGAGFQGGEGGAGTTSINLRGLGTAATLVLVNGRRMAPSGAGGALQQFSDIGVIPLAAVERIEILKGGASSIYGSDAVAGVINIITRKSFDGVRFELDGQSTDDFDQQDGAISGALGASSERGRVLLGMNYFRRNELTGAERDFTAKGQRYSRQGFPATFIAVPPGMINPAMPMQRYAVDPACEAGPDSDLIMDGANPICRYDAHNYRSLVGRAERAAAFGSGEFDLTNHTTVFAELNVSRLRGDSDGVPLPIQFPLPVVPAEHVDNPFGIDVAFFGRPFGAAEFRPRGTADDDTLRLVVGLKGDLEAVAEDTLLESWEWELYGSWGVSRFRNILHDHLREPFERALESCSDPNDLSECFNPFYSAIDGTGTPNSKAVKDSIKGQMEVLADHSLQTYNAGMAGSLFELPGGDLGIAFGAELRHETRSTELDHDANELRYAFLLGNTDALAERDVYSGYLELRWPFFDGIELQTAGRIEHYTDIDEAAVSPTAGVTITPAEMVGRDNAPSALRRLQLRGHVSSAFRSPNIYQSFPGFSTAAVPMVLEGMTVPTYVAVQIFGNPDLKPEKALALSGGIVWSPIRELNLMTDFWHYDYKDRIAAESSAAKVDVWEAGDDPCMATDGIIVTPGPLCELVRVQVKQINLSDHVITNGFDFGAMVSLNGETFGGGAEDWGTLSLGAVGTYTLTFDLPRAQIPIGPINGGSYECDSDSCEVVGHRNAAVTFPPPIPRWRVNFPVTYTASGHAVSVITHYISSLEDDTDAGRTGDFIETIDAFVTLDAMYSYTLKEVVGEELTLRVGVQNVLDQDPPLVTTEMSGFDGSVHDPRGRILYGKLISQF